MKYCPAKDKLFVNPNTGIKYLGTLYQLSSMRGFLHEYKLCLNNLESITDAHVLELVLKTAWKRTIENPIIKHLPGGISVTNNGGGLSMFWQSLYYQEYNYLVKKLYAVPLFFAPDQRAAKLGCKPLGMGNII